MFTKKTTTLLQAFFCLALSINANKGRPRASIEAVKDTTSHQGEGFESPPPCSKGVIRAKHRERGKERMGRKRKGERGKIEGSHHAM